MKRLVNFNMAAYSCVNNYPALQYDTLSADGDFYIFTNEITLIPTNMVSLNKTLYTENGFVFDPVNIEQFKFWVEMYRRRAFKALCNIPCLIRMEIDILSPPPLTTYTVNDTVSYIHNNIVQPFHEIAEYNTYYIPVFKFNKLLLASHLPYDRYYSVLFTLDFQLDHVYEA